MTNELGQRAVELLRTELRATLLLLDEARDAIQPITAAQAKLHRIDLSLAERMDSRAEAIVAALRSVEQPFVNLGDSEDRYVADGRDLNCPACGGSGHVDDVQQPSVSAIEVFRIAGGDTECTPNPSADVAMECLRDLRACYDEAISKTPSTPCPCGLSTCVEPWEPGCGLGNGEEHAVPVAMVPLEPTVEMQCAGFESDAWDALGDAVMEKGGWPYSCRESAECVTAIYKAMLAAAPSSDAFKRSGERPATPAGLIDRIRAAERRIANGHAPRRIPADPEDVDLVLAEVRAFLEGQPPPFWVPRVPAANEVAPSTDQHAAWLRVRQFAIRAHQIVNLLRLAYPEIGELQDDGCLHEAIHDLLRVDWPAPAPRSDDATREADGASGTLKLIAALLEEEGSSVTIFADNADFNGQPDCAIEHTSACTAWAPRRFVGDTLQLCLRNALDMCAAGAVEQPSAPEPPACATCNGRGEIGGHAGQTPESFEYVTEPCPDCAAHPDDAAVDQFAAALKLKLAEARAKGRGGWQNDEPGMQGRLSDMLRAHVSRGDPRDVANFCMFLHQRGESIAPARDEEWMFAASRAGTAHMVQKAIEAAQEPPTTDSKAHEATERIVLTSGQIAQLAEFAGRDNEPFEDQAALVVQRCADGHSGPGIYAHYDELPEEGAIHLDGEWPERRESAPAAAAASEVRRGIADDEATWALIAHAERSGAAAEEGESGKTWTLDYTAFRALIERFSPAAASEAAQEPVAWKITERHYHEYEGSAKEDRVGYLHTRYSDSPAGYKIEAITPLYIHPAPHQREGANTRSVLILEGLRQDDRTILASNVDETVPVTASGAREEAPVIVEIGLDGGEHDLKVAGPAGPHGGESTPATPTKQRGDAQEPTGVTDAMVEAALLSDAMAHERYRNAIPGEEVLMREALEAAERVRHAPKQHEGEINAVAVLDRAISLADDAPFTERYAPLRIVTLRRDEAVRIRAALRAPRTPATNDDVLNAARYLWLRGDPVGRHTLNGGIPWCVHVVAEHGIPTMQATFGDALDAAIDAQRLAGEGA